MMYSLLFAFLVAAHATRPSFEELASCISSVQEVTLVCVVDLIKRKGYSGDDLRDTMLTRPNIEERVVEVDGMTMLSWSYLPTSPGRSSIVLIPGMNGHQIVLKQLATTLMDHFNVYSIDSLGFGESSGTLVSGDLMEAAVDAVAKVIDTYDLDMEKTIIVGHSLGGMIALNFGMRYPHVGGVVDIDGGKFDWVVARDMDQERLRTQAALGSMSLTEIMQASDVLMEIVNTIMKETDGASAAWRTWLDQWYASSGLINSFASIDAQVVLIKAVESEGISWMY